MSIFWSPTGKANIAKKLLETTTAGLETPGPAETYLGCRSRWRLPIRTLIIDGVLLQPNTLSISSVSKTTKKNHLFQFYTQLALPNFSKWWKHSFDCCFNTPAKKVNWLSKIMFFLGGCLFAGPIPNGSWSFLFCFGFFFFFFLQLRMWDTTHSVAKHSIWQVRKSLPSLDDQNVAGQKVGLLSGKTQTAASE